MAPSQVPETFVAKRFGEPAWLLAKPLTYMNRSGEAVAALARYYDIAPADLLVVVDEAALPFTRLRARARGSAGGHNGLKSVIAGSARRSFPGCGWGWGAETAGATSPITCSRSSRAANVPISRRSSPGRPMPPRCSPWRTSAR